MEYNNIYHRYIYLIYVNTFLDNRNIIVRYRARPKRFIQNNGRFIPRGPRGRFGQRPGRGFMQQGRNIKRGRRF